MSIYRNPTPLQRVKALVKVGARLELLSYEIDGEERVHKFKHLSRAVTLAAPTQFALAVDNKHDDTHPSAWSYCEWPKASQLTWIDDDTFRIVDGGVSLTYRIGIRN